MTTPPNDNGNGAGHDTDMMKRKPLILISAPSAGGKTEVTAQVRQLELRLGRVCTTTTRPPRPGEVDGVHYHFISRAEFTAREGLGNFIETDSYAGHRYGTEWFAVSEVWDADKVPVLCITLPGVKAVRAKFCDAFSVFLLPPSLEILRGRLERRAAPDDDIDERLKIAEKEIGEYPQYCDLALISDNGTVLQTARRLLVNIRDYFEHMGV